MSCPWSSGQTSDLKECIDTPAVFCVRSYFFHFFICREIMVLDGKSQSLFSLWLWDTEIHFTHTQSLVR